MTDSSPDSSSAPLALVPLPGSERPRAANLVPASVPLNSGDTAEATLILRRRAEMGKADSLDATMTSEELGQRFGADPADAALVGTTLTGLGIRVIRTDLPSRRVRVEGTLENLGRVFGTSLTAGSVDGLASAHRVRSGQLSIPVQLDGIVTAVLGLDNRPQARPQFRVSSASATAVSYTPVELGQLYNFPAGTDGAGQTIAIIELGGGYETADLTTYFSALGVGNPSVSAVGVDGAKNEPGQDPEGADGEVLLDIEVIGALSPASKILVYFAPNTDAGFVDAVAEASHATPAPAAISISWGQSEDQWTAQARNAFDDALLDAAALGVTVTAAAGDNGSSDGSGTTSKHADFPASSPHALACGGTSLHANGTTISKETVWNDGAGRGATGGGVSDVFALPSWQKGVGVPAVTGSGGRGVPDVAGNADPETGYQVLVDGTRAVYGGTSAVAPLWASLVARLVQSLGAPLGLLQPKLYPLHAALHDITSGNNGAYKAKKGWDACTGLGTPDGTAILAGLKAAKN